MLEDRIRFVEDTIVHSKEKSASENIYDTIVHSIERFDIKSEGVK